MNEEAGQLTFANANDPFSREQGFVIKTKHLLVIWTSVNILLIYWGFVTI